MMNSLLQIFRNNIYNSHKFKVSSLRSITTSVAKGAEQDVDETEGDDTPVTKNLRPIIDVETSKRYMKSKAYETTYRGSDIWVPYRRNHKGGIAPYKTRKTCIRAGVISTGNPCPICRDEYLVLHPENTDLLKQFISKESGQVVSYRKTGLCQKQHKTLLGVIEQAWDSGYIEMPIPFRKYDYSQYYSAETMRNSGTRKE